MKKILSICAFLLLCTVTLFAQSVPVSKTSQSTYGVFKTDVDNFTNVNAWQDVELNNMFTSISYGNKSVELGFAKNLENGFLGLWLIGDVGFDFKSESKKDTSDSVTSSGTLTSVTKTYTENGKGSEFTFGALFGKGDMAYKASIYYEGNADDSIVKSSSDSKSNQTIENTTITTNTTEKSENIVDKYVLRPEFSVGLNSEKAKYYGSLSLDINKDTTKNYSYTKEGETEDEVKPEPVNNDTISLTLGLGASFDLASKEKLTQAFAVDSNFALNFIDDDVVEDTDEDNVEETDVTKYTSNYIGVVPSYSFKYNGDERLTVGFKAVAYMSWYNSTVKQTTGSHNLDAEAIYYTNSDYEEKNFRSDFNFYPYASLAIAYDVIPSKLTFNASTIVALPYLSYTLETTKTTNNYETVVNGNNAGEGSSTSKDSSFTVTGFDRTCTMNFASGFTYNLSKNLTFDATWNIVGDLFNSTLNSTLSPTADLLTTLNKVLVHNVSLGITFKM